MNYYTSTIPPTLAWKIKEKGMSIWTEGHSIWCPSYAEVFDWLMLEKQLFVIVEPYWDFASEFITDLFEASVVRQGSIHAPIPTIISTTWHKAANAAIEKALTLI